MTEGDRGRRSGAASSWLAGLVLGALGGFCLFVFPVVGVVVLTGAALLVLRKGATLPGASGLLMGLGGIWVAVFGRVKLTCQAADGCTSPSIAGYLAAAAVVLAVGIILSVVSARSRRG